MKDRALFEYDPLLTLEEIEANYNMPYTRFHVLHRMVPKGEFPAPIRLGAGPKCRLAWRRSWIEAWLNSRPSYVRPLVENDDEALE